VEKEKNIAVIATDEGDDRRSSRLVEGQSLLDSFAGWGPRIAGSPRNILRGLN
jgi:hypothetical protein